MDKRIRDDERAVSELVGEIMLIGVVIIAFGIIAVSVYSYIDKTPDTPHIEVAGRCDTNSNYVYLKHQGGEPIDKKDLRILVDVGGNTSTFENLEGLWTLGSVIGLSIENIAQNDTVRVAIVHVLSDTVLTSGDVAEGTFESTATNIAPSADAGEDQRNDLCNDTGILEVAFDGAGSYDPDGSITRYDWDFGDWNTSGGKGATVTHAYTSPGRYTVTLIVTDNDGATASDTCLVTIDQAAPLSANAGPDRWVALWDVVELNGSKSTGCIRSWHWDLGDGSTISSKAVMHTYGSTGTYNATLTVKDYSGGENVDYMVVEVLNATVRIIDPGDGDVVRGTVHVDAHVFGILESMINRVEFFSGSGLIGTDSDGTAIANNTVQYSIVWDTTGWIACADSLEGGRKISAIVYHSGQTGKSQDVVIEVDNDELPRITIVAPGAGGYVNRTTTVRAIVADDRDVTNVVFLANGVFRGIMSHPSLFDQNWCYRVPVTVHAGGNNWNCTPVAHTINFTEELVSLGESGIIDMNSVRVVEVCDNGTFICEVPSRVKWTESGRISAGGVTNGGFEEEDGWNYTESRIEWDIGYDNTTSYTGSRSFLIGYPWNQGSSAGDYAKVTRMIRGSQITWNSHVLRVWVRDNYNGPTSGHHFKQVLVGETVLWEGDVAGGAGSWTPAIVNLSDYIGEDINLTLRVYDKRGVGNFGVSVWWDDIAILTNTTGDVAWIINGNLAAGTEQHYSVYFDTIGCGAKETPGYAWFNSTASKQPSVTNRDTKVTCPYYTYQWNTSRELEGATSVTVNATDDSCPVNQSNKTTRIVYVDNIPDPAIKITNPAIHENVTGTMSITTAIANMGPADAGNVEFYVLPEVVNGEWMSIGNGTAPAFTCLWDTTCWQAGYGDWEWAAGSTGKYYLRANLRDQHNQSVESDPNFYVWVTNPSPTVTIRTPANGSTVGGTVTITADIMDNGDVVHPVTCKITNESGDVVKNGDLGYWSRRKEVTITSSTSLLNYQINLTINYEDGMQSDFDDLRFVAGDGSNIPYWTIHKTDGVSADFWVNVSSIPAGNSTIYVYYGNAAATSLSDGDKTFYFFDDFSDLDKWTQHGRGSITTTTQEDRSVVKFSGCNEGRISTNTQVSGNISIERMIKNYGGASDCDDWCGIIADGDRRVWRYSDNNINKFAGTTGDNPAPQKHGIWNYYSGLKTSTTGTGTITRDWKLHSITRLGTTIKSVYDGETMSITPPNVLAAGHVQILNDADSVDRGVYVDWIRVRRHAANKPVCVVGSEENSDRYSALWNASTRPCGNYTISISAEDGSGQTNTSCVTVVYS